MVRSRLIPFPKLENSVINCARQILARAAAVPPVI
jgi:hypothetical protein